MLRTLPPKWDPSSRQPEDYEDEEMEQLEHALSESGSDMVPFDRRVTTRGDLGQAFRIFTEESPVYNGSIPMELSLLRHARLARNYQVQIFQNELL